MLELQNLHFYIL